MTAHEEHELRQEPPSRGRSGCRSQCAWYGGGGRVGSHVDSADIVAVDDCSNLQRNMEFLKKLPQPATLGDDVSNRPVLGLRTRPGYHGLPFGGPGHQVVS